MNHTENIGYEAVLKIVSQWPKAQQTALVEEILKTVSSRVELPKQRRQTLDHALGLLMTDRRAPSDEKVECWLAEHRMEK